MAEVQDSDTKAYSRARIPKHEAAWPASSAGLGRPCWAAIAIAGSAEATTYRGLIYATPKSFERGKENLGIILRDATLVVKVLYRLYAIGKHAY
jgi:hypothetical protein